VRQSRGGEEIVCAAQSRRSAKRRTVARADIQGEKAAGRVVEQSRVIAPMLLHLCAIVLLLLANLRVNEASVTGVIIANEAVSSPAVNVAAVDQVHTTNRSGLSDLGSVGGAQNQMEETRREYEESLKTYRELAHKEPDIYLRFVAITLNNLGLLDNAQNRWGEARKEAEEALKIYRELAQKEPETYLPHVAITLNNLGIFDSDKNQMNESRKEYEEALKIYRELAQKEPETYLPYVAATLNNLGILDRAQNRPVEARKVFEEAMKIYEAFAKQYPDQFWPLVERIKKLLTHLPK
jgi:tetratricopeptide (TPR) repeat protein